MFGRLVGNRPQHHQERDDRGYQQFYRQAEHRQVDEPLYEDCCGDRMQSGLPEVVVLLRLVQREVEGDANCDEPDNGVAPLVRLPQRQPVSDHHEPRDPRGKQQDRPDDLRLDKRLDDSPKRRPDIPAEQRRGETNGEPDQ